MNLFGIFHYTSLQVIVQCDQSKIKFKRKPADNLQFTKLTSQPFSDALQSLNVKSAISMTNHTSREHVRDTGAILSRRFNANKARYNEFSFIAASGAAQRWQIQFRNFHSAHTHIYIHTRRGEMKFNTGSGANSAGN